MEEIDYQYALVYFHRTAKGREKVCVAVLLRTLQCAYLKRLSSVACFTGYEEYDYSFQHRVAELERTISLTCCYQPMTLTGVLEIATERLRTDLFSFSPILASDSKDVTGTLEKIFHEQVAAPILKTLFVDRTFKGVGQ